ncbi:MAG: hypothetical protein MJY59_04365 [Bacteroidaceae bacterium]|nr:hypothetical protein [Bacteroidaceae bacterium]
MARTKSKKNAETALDAAEGNVAVAANAGDASAAEKKTTKSKRTRTPKKQEVTEEVVKEKAVVSDIVIKEEECEDASSDDGMAVQSQPEVSSGISYMKPTKDNAPFAIEDLDKANVWGLNEQELYDMYIEGRRQENFSENEVHYMNLIRPVFEFMFFNINNRNLYDKYKSQGFSIFSIPSNSSSNAIAIKRRPIKKITDITLENIYHIQPAELLRLIDENMGTGWQGLPLYLQDIILAGFFVDCSVLPALALHKAGGIIDRRKADGYDVLEIARGSWIEAVFVKVKPKQDKLHFETIVDKPNKKKNGEDEDMEDEEIDDEELDDEELDDAEDEEIEEEEPELEDIDMIDPDSDD